ncbi:MAG: hypothetical protein K9J84_07170 [Bacteroidia bacterium]|nr:hypothetical protein [Bacteroidia bacterium]
MKYRINKIVLLFLLLPFISFKGNCFGVSKQFLEEKNSFEYQIKHDITSPIDINRIQSSVTGSGVSLKQIHNLNFENQENGSNTLYLFSFTKKYSQLLNRYSPRFLRFRVLRL